MTRQHNHKRSSFRRIASFIAVLTLIALAALAHTTGPGPRSGKSLGARASANPNAAQGARELSRLLDYPMDANPFIFVSPVIYDSGGSIATSVAVGDLNGDGKPDLVVASCSIGSKCLEDVGGVGVLLGNGDGTFQPVATYASGGFQSVSVTIADVNGDGKPDLLIANSTTSLHDTEGSVAVLLGNGDGTFQAAVTYDAMARVTTSAAVADVNGDGKLDIAVSSSCSAGGCGGSNSVVAILLGNGDGTFRSGAIYNIASTEGPRFVTLADVSRDGKLDLLVADDGGAEVMLGNGDGTFRAPQTYSSGGGAASIAVSDVNGDGKLDLLVVNGDSLALLLGNGDGSFQPPTSVLSGNVTYVAVRDVNGDGKPDLVTLYGGVGVMLGNGDGTFQTVSSNDDFDGGGVGVAIADMNGDGKPDIAIAIQDGTGGLGVLLNNNGATPTTTSLASSANPARIHEVVTYTATVTAQSGESVSGVVLFRQNDGIEARATVTGNQATFSLKYRNPGSHSNTASYSGDLKNASSAAGPLTEQIIKAHSSKTALTTSGSPSFPGQTVTFTATVTSTGGAIPDGELVTFFDGKTTLGSVALAGGTAAYATSSLAVKRHNIKAIYAGDAEFNPSTGSVLQVVESWPTATILTSSPNPSAQGHAVTFTATVTSDGPLPTGTVKFVDGNSVDLGSAKLSGGVAILTRSTLAAGTHPIFAEYKGNITSHKSFSNTVNQVVQ